MTLTDRLLLAAAVLSGLLLTRAPVRGGPDDPPPCGNACQQKAKANAGMCKSKCQEAAKKCKDNCQKKQ